MKRYGASVGGDGGGGGPTAKAGSPVANNKERRGGRRYRLRDAGVQHACAVEETGEGGDEPGRVVMNPPWDDPPGPRQ